MVTVIEYSVSRELLASGGKHLGSSSSKSSLRPSLLKNGREKCSAHTGRGAGYQLIYK